MKTKLCKKCNEVKPAEEFSCNKRIPDGLAVYCRTCTRNYIHQRAVRLGKPIKPRIAPLERFKSRLLPVPECGCILWDGKIDHAGYGMMSVGMKQLRAHRYYWEKVRGPIPAGLSVLHKCDVRMCVNPDHLFLGTQLDNMRDMVQKGRAGKRGRRRNGEPPPYVAAILNDPDLYLSTYKLAAKHGVSPSTVGRIRKGSQGQSILNGEKAQITPII